MWLGHVKYSTSLAIHFGQETMAKASDYLRIYRNPISKHQLVIVINSGI
jgi:hypothetical protein